MPLPKTPLLTVDCVVYDGNGAVLLIRRGHPPFQGHYALPGGFVDENENTEQACRRELLEETGVEVGALELVGVYSEAGRDPRGPVCSVVYLARGAKGAPRAGSDAAAAEWVKDWASCDLAFDHRRILTDAQRCSNK